MGTGAKWRQNGKVLRQTTVEDEEIRFVLYFDFVCFLSFGLFMNVSLHLQLGTSY